ncbi:O-antigen ligase domain-containing protein, partial [Pyxidicoccus sp. 3LFB2]
MPSASSPTVDPRLRRLVAGVLVFWAVGLVLAEVVLQVAAGAAVLVAGILAARRQLRLAPDVRAYVLASLALCAWQLVSPA